MNSAAPAPIRVVRIIDRLNIGGPARHVVWLAAGLHASGFDTVLITGTVAPGEGDMAYFARAAGVEPVVIPEMSRAVSLRDARVIVRLLRQLWQLKPQIVHTHKAKAGTVGRVAALLYKWLTPTALWLRPRECRIVHTYHGHTFHSYHSPAWTRLFLAIERALARLATDRIIAISPQQRQEISEQFRIGRPHQFRVIPLGIDLDEVGDRHGHFRAELGVTGDEVLIGIVGRLCEVKNQVMLLDAAAQLLRELGESPVRIRFVFIGDGHLRGALEEQARRLGVMDRIAFAGFRDDMLSLYADLDLVALTSLNEGTPLTLIEAMCCGRAVASTEVGGVVDIMGARRATADGFSVWDHGVTAPSRDVDGFARALRFLVERPALRREMGERGRAFVRSQLSKDRLVRDIERLYRELLGVKTVRSRNVRAAVESL